MSKSWMIAFNYMKKLNGEDPGQTPDPEPEPNPDPTPTPNPSEKCPNKPECNVETCLNCGVEYCLTHGFHVCIIGGKEYSRPYLRVETESLGDAGFGNTFWITHSKLQRYNFTDKRWENFEDFENFGPDTGFESKSYPYNELKKGMYTYKKLTKEDMSVTVKEDDLGEYVCAYDKAPPRS
jgi:hypothetical protein